MVRTAFAAAFKGIRYAIRRGFEARQRTVAANALAVMNDRLLKDIGLHRSQIDALEAIAAEREQASRTRRQRSAD
jgi:uncharacterized protein YjiS (DUF1127 family)